MGVAVGSRNFPIEWNFVFLYIRFDFGFFCFPTFFKNKWIIGSSSNPKIKIELQQVLTVQMEEMTAKIKQTNGQTDKQKNRQTDKQTNRQTEEQTNRQTDK